MSKAWGGLTILTSRPYALCHQLSKGAEVSTATHPQPARKTPSGARSPKTLTDAALSSSWPNVHLAISHAQMMPASTPQA